MLLIMGRQPEETGGRISVVGSALGGKPGSLEGTALPLSQMQVVEPSLKPLSPHTLALEADQ